MDHKEYLSDKEINELKDLYDKASKGFWYTSCTGSDLKFCVNCVNNKLDKVVCISSLSDDLINDNNTKFIAAAYNYFPKLLDELILLRSEIYKVKTIIKIIVEILKK